MAQNEEACLLKKEKGRLGMSIPGYYSCRKQMKICHGPFKIRTLRIGEPYQSLPLNNRCAAERALWGLGSIMISVRRGTGTQ